MAHKEGQQIDTLPAQMYGWDGSSPKRINADSSGKIVTSNHFADTPSLDAAGAVRTMGRLTAIVTGIGGTSATRCIMNWKEIR